MRKIATPLLIAFVLALLSSFAKSGKPQSSESDSVVTIAKIDLR